MLSGADPSVNVVLLEDAMGIAGVLVAAGCMTITHVTHSHYADCIGCAVLRAAGFTLRPLDTLRDEYLSFVHPYVYLVLPLARSSLAIGALLGVVASFIIYRNTQLLLGRLVACCRLFCYPSDNDSF